MTAYTEVELRCDGIEGDPFGCEAIIHAGNVTAARVTATRQGWLVNLRGIRRKDLCPDHKSGGDRG